MTAIPIHGSAIPSSPLWCAAPIDAVVRSAQELRDLLCRTDQHRPAPDLTQMNRVLRLDEGHSLVEVQCAVRWPDLAAFLAGAGFASGLGPGAAAEYGLPATIGDCIARNPAAPDGSPFVSHVESLAVVGADGQLRCVSRRQHTEWFRAVNGGLGLIAAVYSVTLRLDTLARAFAGAEPVIRFPAAESLHDRAEGCIRLMVPPARLDAFLAELRGAFDDYRLPIASLCVRRAAADTETLLRWATEELAVVEVSFPEPETLPGRVAATQVRGRLLDAALAHGGRFDIATSMEARREQVEAAYPGFSAFLAAKRRHDPQLRLSSPLFRHYEALFRRERLEVRWSMT
jgi:FAD/FMN-containing dehydrogenase